MRKVWIFLAFVLAAPMALADTLRITALGDSLVHGYGLPQGQGFVPQLETWLHEKGVDVVVANAGVSGDTTAGGAARIDWTLSDQPDALIVLFGGNDMLRGLSPSEARGNLHRILSAAQGAEVEVMLIGMLAPGNYGPDYKAEFDALYGDLASEFGVVLHADAFAGIRAEVGADPAAAQIYMQEDGIHPNAAGVALNIEAMGPALLELLSATGAGS